MSESKLTIWNRLEPARVRAVWTAVVALLLALGIAIPAGADEIATAVIGVLAVVIPLVQGELTRRVVSPATHALSPQDAATRDALAHLDDHREDTP